MESLVQSQMRHNDNRERIRHNILAGRSVFRREGEVIFHDTADDDVKCTICMDNLQPGEYACRLKCGHAFHAECWVECLNHGPLGTDQQTEASCPNCRGKGVLVSAWQWLDSRMLFQQVQAHTVVTQTINYMNITTPGSVITEREHGTPGQHEYLRSGL